jgi:hypothetical protein
MKVAGSRDVKHLIGRSLVLSLLVASCATGSHSAMTAAEHERLASHYDATADSIEHECWKDLRHELTVSGDSLCWKSDDIRFLEANRNAAFAHRTEAARLRSLSASR